MGVKTDWDKKREKRTANIGFITRINGFNPIPAERASALAIEIQSWQASKGTKPYSISAEYRIPQGHGVNLFGSHEYDKFFSKQDAVSAYIKTPLDPNGILKIQGTDVGRYEPQSFLQNLKKSMYAKSPGYWEDVLVFLLPILLFLLTVYMFYKIQER